MFWKIHWQCVLFDEDGCITRISDQVYDKRFEEWDSAMGCFVAHINSHSVARVWWTVHLDENDKGSVMCGYTIQWDEHVTLVNDKGW